MEGIKNPYGESLIEIEGGLWNHNSRVRKDIVEPYSYTDREFRACIKIFSEAMMWKLWKYFEGANIENRIEAADNVGPEIRNLVNKFTGVDSYDLYEL